MIPSSRVSEYLSRHTKELTVNQTELGHGVADVRVTVEGVWDTVGSPSGVSHRGLAKKDLLHVDLGDITVLGGERCRETLGNVLSESSDLADFLEKNERSAGRITIDSDTWVSVNLVRRLDLDVPAESYPRYSSLARPLHKTSQTYARSFSTR
jgi:hypothetical protein